MYDDGPLSTRQQLDALKLERERAKLIADQAKAQQQVQKVASDARQSFAEQDPRRTDVPPVKSGVPVPQTRSLTDAEVRTSESSNNPSAKNPNSSASGLYQMTDAAKADAIKVNPKLAEMDYAQPAVQEQYRDAYKESIRKQLIARGIPPESIDDNMINQSWVVGAKGYNEISKSQPNAPLGYSLSKAAIDKNPNLQNKTALDYLSSPNPYSRVDTKVNNVAPLPPPVDQSIMDPRDAMAMQPPPVANGVPPDFRLKTLDEIAPVINNGVPVNQNAGNTRSISVEPQGNVKPRPTSTAFTGGVERSNWDRRYGKTHNPDGTPKGVVPLNETDLPALSANNVPVKTTEPTMANAEVVPPLETDLPAMGVTTSTSKQEINVEDLPDIQRNKFDQLGDLGSQYEAEALKTSLMDTDFPGYTSNAVQLEKLMLQGKDEEAASKINPSFWSKLSESFGSLFSDKEFIKFGILLAGGLLSGGSFGGSLKYAGLYALQSADKREAFEAQSKAKIEAEDRANERAISAEGRRFDNQMKVAEFTAGKADERANRAENNRLRVSLRKDGYSTSGIEKYLRSKNPEDLGDVTDRYVRTGDSTLMTITQPFQLTEGGPVIKPGEPLYSYKKKVTNGPNKGQTIEVVRIPGVGDIPKERLAAVGGYLTSWDESKYGSRGKIDAQQNFIDSSVKTAVAEFTSVLGKPEDLAGQGIITPEMMAVQAQDFFQDKGIDTTDKQLAPKLRRAIGQAGRQMAEDIKDEDGPKTISNFAMYLDSNFIKFKSGVSYDLFALDTKDGKQMAPADIINLKNLVRSTTKSNEQETYAEISRMAKAWSAKENANIRNKYKDSDTETAFARYVKDTMRFYKRN